MKQMRMLLWAVSALLAPAQLCATTLNVCNKGQIEVRYATAHRHGHGFFPGSWVVQGWYPIPPGACENVYHTNSSVGEDIHVAFGFTDSTGTWGPVRSLDNPDSQVKRSDKHLCVTNDPFEYTLAVRDNSNYIVGKDDFDGGACKEGQVSFPAAIYFHAAYDEGCGSYTCYGGKFEHAEFNIALTAKDRAIAAGPQTVTSSRGPDAPTPVKTPAQTAAEEKASAAAQGLGSILKALQDAADAARQQRAQAEQAGRQREAQEDDARTKRAEARIDALRGAAAQGNAKAQLSVKLADEYEDSWKQLWASPHYAVSAYDPQWMGKNVVLRGTVASVQLDTSGYPVYMTVYFKESLDGTVTAYSPYSDLFRGKYGSDFSGLIGKVVEVAGHVNQFRKAKASINFTDPKQLRVAGNP